MIKITFSIIVYCLCLQCLAADTDYIKVLFLYGSKPARAYKETERKWFGGVLGGHTGIEIDSNEVLSFFPQGKFHWFAKKDSLHSRYAIHAESRFWNIFGYNGDSVKKAVFYIPVSQTQKQVLDSIEQVYLAHTPYDYAFIGMRCGAAAYEILAQAGIVKRYTYRRTYMKIFYPKKLRKSLLKLARENGWKVETNPGTARRIWEKN